jgi:hypothetical protein
MWHGKRKKSPNQHGTRSLLDIFPVRATINVSGSAKSSNGTVSDTKTKANTNGRSDSMAKSAPTIKGLLDTLRLQSQCSLIAPDDGCGNKSPTTFAAAKMKFTIPFPNDNNATKDAYFSSSSTTPSATMTALKKQPSRDVKTVSYCDTSNLELENDEDGYELKKKAKANTTDRQR